MRSFSGLLTSRGDQLPNRFVFYSSVGLLVLKKATYPTVSRGICTSFLGNRAVASACLGATGGDFNAVLGLIQSQNIDSGVSFVPEDTMHRKDCL